MLTFIVVLAVIGVIFAGTVRLLDTKGLLPGKAKGMIASPTSGLFDVSKDLYERYMALPEDSRPFPDSTLLPLLRSLDAKHSLDKTKLYEHFNAHSYASLNGAYYGALHHYKFGWKKKYPYDCSHRGCEFSAYADIYSAIEDVRQAIEERERKALNAAHDTNDSVQQLIDRLRTEAKIHRDVTKEFY